ncbi:ABC transporter permease [Paraburkholderia dipogonis]|jgi:lipopolysaccharide transport system permease protein|uniref:ABC transporter permease n=1 Tax=Paraburkholderia dipogonis TaxID=1211383 RepID=UPI0038BAA6E4
MNPHAIPSGSPLAALRSLRSNKDLIVNLISREVIGRYRGSFMGLLWSFFNPVLMLAVYTFVFSVVFKTRWAGASDSRAEFALVLFAGLMCFNFFAECVNRAPSLILSNANYVKKVIFPLEVLPVVALGSAAFHFCVSMSVWMIFYLIFLGIPHVTVLLAPIALIPLVLFTLGCVWILSALGVYLRDVSQFIGIAVSMLMFLSPIFYPVSALPERYRGIIALSPLTFIIEQIRNSLIWGNGIDWRLWAMWTAATALVAVVGFASFQKSRRGFADVI